MNDALELLAFFISVHSKSQIQTTKNYYNTTPTLDDDNPWIVVVVVVVVVVFALKEIRFGNLVPSLQW